MESGQEFQRIHVNFLFITTLPLHLFFYNLKGKQSTSGPFGIGESWSPNECPAVLCRNYFDRFLQVSERK